MQNSLQKQIVDLLKRSTKILILPSSPLDGDSLGSAIAFYKILKKLEKDVTVLCSETVPDVFDFLPNIKIIGTKLISSNDFIITVDLKKIPLEKMKTVTENDKLNIILSPTEGNFSENDITFNKGEIAYDLIITVDCAEPNQLKNIYENNIEMFHRVPVINIDHHISNTHFGKINYVDIMASSTTELLLSLFEELAREENIELIDEDVATLLLTGIITDTGSFQNANTTPRAFEVASELVAYGARQQEIIQYIYKTKQLSQLKLWGRVLTKIQTDEKHRLIWSVVSQQDFRDTGSLEEETGDIIDELMTNAPGSEIVFLMKEKKDSSISVSLRTTSASIDAAKIAEIFGGGGHTQAAGFRLEGLDLIEAEYKVLTTIRTFQAERLNLKIETSPQPSEKLAAKTPRIELSNQPSPPPQSEVSAQSSLRAQPEISAESSSTAQPKVSGNFNSTAQPEITKKKKKTKNTFSFKTPPHSETTKENLPELRTEAEASYKFDD